MYAKRDLQRDLYMSKETPKRSIYTKKNIQRDLYIPEVTYKETLSSSWYLLIRTDLFS